MAKLLDGIDTVEGLIAVALIMAFVLLLGKPVKGMLAGLTDGDPMVAQMETLISAVQENNKHQAENVRLMEENQDRFKETISLLHNIRLDMVKGKANG